MYNKTQETIGTEELVIRSGNGNDAAVLTGEKQSRIYLAEGVKLASAEILERYESILDGYSKKVNDRIELNLNAALALADKTQDDKSPKMGTPSTTGYKMWDVFAVGPVQFGVPPFRPNKIVAAGDVVWFFVSVVTNPLPIPGGGGFLPSATQLVAGRPYRLRLQSLNLTNVTAGPAIAINSIFPGVPSQTFLLGLSFRTPLQGRPELYEVNVTADVTDNTQQPMAAFATHMFDLDVDPGFPNPVPPQNAHMHVEQPMRILSYRR
jgi:hypothetical protein